MNEDEKWIRKTFELAEKGINGASPNPLVGCVVVKNNKVVGEGIHKKFGGPHAEINALRQAGRLAKGADLYLNLEPCCHWGKTPPCTDAIIRSGIRRVVAAMVDPNPLVRHKGIQKLKEAKIKIKTGLCETEAKDLNRFFIKYMTKNKPYVILKSALSLDGKIAAYTGNSQGITSAPSVRFSYQIRTQVDGILVGAETVRRDNPSLTSHGLGRNPVRIIVTQSGRFQKKRDLFDLKTPTWIYCGSSPKIMSSHANVEWIEMASREGKIKFGDILKSCAKRGISKLLIEGGGEISACALEENEVDEILFFVAPRLIGGRSAKTPFEGNGFSAVKKAVKLTKVEVKKIGDDFLFSARIAKES